MHHTKKNHFWDQILDGVGFELRNNLLFFSFFSELSNVLKMFLENVQIAYETSVLFLKIAVLQSRYQQDCCIHPSPQEGGSLLSRLRNLSQYL